MKEEEIEEDIDKINEEIRLKETEIECLNGDIIHLQDKIKELEEDLDDIEKK